MMKNDAAAIFLDTSALIALLDAGDQFHPQIQSWFAGLAERRRFLTSNLILAEFLTFFSRRGNLKVALDYHKELLKDPTLKIVWIDPTLHEEASTLLSKYADKRLSLADAASFVLMKRERLSHALTFDADFTRAGFTTLP